MVDDDDFDALNNHNWHAAKQPNTFYACRTVRVGDGRKKTIWMHRVINKTPSGLKTDHIDGNGLNNSRTNLRSVSHADNMINGGRFSKNKPKYRGVSWHKRLNKWVAQITVDYKNNWIGSFDTPEEARAAYQAARIRIREGKVYRND